MNKEQLKKFIDNKIEETKYVCKKCKDLGYTHIKFGNVSVCQECLQKGRLS